MRWLGHLIVGMRQILRPPRWRRRRPQGVERAFSRCGGAESRSRVARALNARAGVLRFSFTLVGAWLSLVEHSVRDRGVGGSNPLAPTTFPKSLRISNVMLGCNRA